MKQRKKGEKVLRQKQTRVTGMLMLLFMGMLSVIGFKNGVFAAELPTSVPEIISIETLGGNENEYSGKETYLYPAVSGLKQGQEVTYTSSDSNIFVIGYEDGFSFDGTLTETYSKPSHKLKNDVWSTYEMCLLAKNEGHATLTVTISGGGQLPKTNNYTVQVTKALPRLNKITHKSIKAGLYDDYVEVTVENVFPDYTIAVSSNKKNVLKVGRKPYKYDKYVAENSTYTAKKLGIKKQAEDATLYFCAMKKGTINFTVSVLDQNGEILESKDYALQAKAYENPFSSLKIGTTNFTKHFNHYKTVGDGTGAISSRQAKNTLGKPIVLKLKKGYRFEKITYLNKDEWEGMVKRRKLTVQKTGDSYKAVFPSQCWDMRIIYKDKKGKKKSVSFCYSAFLFSN